MDIKALVQFQLNGSFNLLTEVANGASDEEWRSRPFPQANLIGFTVWHCARTIDWAVNCAMRGGPELADRNDWRDVNVAGAAFGAGASRAAADGVPLQVARSRVIDYVQALREDVMSWFAAATPEELAGTTDLRACQAKKPEYMAPAVWEELENLDGIPKWQFLVRPAVSHIRVHYGEVSSQLEALRAAATAG